ncbi:MAG: tRNA pseudouridine(55) synthase TruB [Sedimentisphaerales bacterium]|nr:tRNA pseudouridine(55) synthase TruB [Sedimentisphaerales bacterium]
MSHLLPPAIFIAINKPIGMTSHDVIDAVRRITGQRRVGHAGTLDPLARGVLVVGVGRAATRQLETIVAGEKEYITTIRLGITSTTDDAEGTLTAHPTTAPPDRAMVEAALPGFIGEIQQRPPAYSAIKINGRPAYKLARKGKAPLMEARPVVIHTLELLDYTWPDLRLRAVTGKGVYIRSLARDIGQALGIGGYMADLERTRVGSYDISKALSLQQLEALWPEIAAASKS